VEVAVVGLGRAGDPGVRDDRELHAAPALGIVLGEDVADDVGLADAGVGAHPGGDGEVVRAQAQRGVFGHLDH
jgi:hypothetical protein